MAFKEGQEPDYYAEDHPTFRAYEELLIWKSLKFMDLSRREICKIPGITESRVNEWLKSLIRINLIIKKGRKYSRATEIRLQRELREEREKPRLTGLQRSLIKLETRSRKNKQSFIDAMNPKKGTKK